MLTSDRLAKAYIRLAEEAKKIADNPAIYTTGQIRDITKLKEKRRESRKQKRNTGKADNPEGEQLRLF